MGQTDGYCFSSHFVAPLIFCGTTRNSSIFHKKMHAGDNHHISTQTTATKVFSYIRRALYTPSTASIHVHWLTRKTKQKQKKTKKKKQKTDGLLRRPNPAAPIKMQRFSIPQLVDLFPSILAPVNWKTYIVLLDDNTTYDLYTRRKKRPFFSKGGVRRKRSVK